MKKLFLGIVIGAAITTACTAYAEKAINATHGAFNFLVNGKAVQVNTTPLVVESTSYLPLREVSGLLGYEVEYDADSRTIGLSNDGKKYLNKEPSSEQQPMSPQPTTSPTSDNSNVSSQGFVYKKLPLTKTIKSVTITLNSITILEDKTAFDITIKNDNDFTIKLDIERGIRTNNDVQGKTSEMISYYNGRSIIQNGMTDFRKESIKSGEERHGIAYMFKINKDTERINFFPASHEAIADFSFYIDTKGYFN